MQSLSRLSRSSLGASALRSAGIRLKHTLPDLPYSYGALEPAISGKIMEV